MPYEYLEDEAIADVAFKASAETLEGLFYEAGMATVNLQTEISSLETTREEEIEIIKPTTERLLKAFLDEIIYWKDADLFFVKDFELSIDEVNGEKKLSGKLIGDIFDKDKHPMGNDLKAITWHNFELNETDDGYECYVLIDI